MKFSDALDRKLEEIKRPPNPPTGHYTWTVSKHPDIEENLETRDGRTYDRVTFQCQIVSPSDDVDEDELAEFGNVQGAMSRKQFLFFHGEDDKAAFERSMFNLKRFLGHCGVEADDMPMSEALAASVNCQFLGELTHRPDPNDPEVIYAELGRTAEA